MDGGAAAATAADARPWALRHPISAAACKEDTAALHALLYDAASGAARVAPAALDALDEEGRAPLHYAAWNGLLGAARLLLRAGASTAALTPDRRASPLHLAAGMAHPELVALLLGAGADPLARDCDKWTPLALARQDLFGKPEAVASIVALLEAAERAASEGAAGARAAAPAQGTGLKEV